MVETTKMQRCIDRLGLRLKVVWIPDQNQKIHGEVVQKNLYIYDLSEEEAWRTFIHEVFEFAFKEVTRPYRILVNELIGVVEKLIYQKKEEFLDFLPVIIDEINAERENKKN